MEASAPASYDLPAWTRYCAKHGLTPIGKSETPQATVYIAERVNPGIAVSLDPIESQTHYVVAWALEQNVDGSAQMTYGRSIKFRAADVIDRNKRIQAALIDAAQHLGPASGRTH